MSTEPDRRRGTMNGAEPTLTEQAPVALALARVQRGPKPPPRVRRAARPSLPLVRLEESVAMGFAKPDSDDNDNIEDSYEIVETPSPVHRRASAVPTPCRKTSNSISFFARKGYETRRASLAAPLCHPVDVDKARRPSWAVRLQLERKKRRKSGDDDEVETLDEDEVARPPAGPMRRRQSWWNVLVPENILKNRSRRASQQLSRSDENIVQTQKRSKSRSVDHGFAAPFDLDSLRSKVEGRFDSVHREEDESSKRSSISSQTPSIKTINYVVRDRETLTSLAARFDTTPSELTKINRLATPYIFPGQNLLVPEKIRDGDKDSDGPSESGDGNSDSGLQSTEPQEKELLENLRPVSPEAPSSPAAPQRFLKINVRHITDGQGVVSGVLLVTPNAVMFDPNVSDFLVIEHGPELYGVIAPMEFVVNAAIYFDIAHMRTHDSDPSGYKGEKPVIYYMNQSNLEDKDSTLLKDETFSELHEASEHESKEDEESEVNLSKDKSADDSERGGDAFPKAFDRELVTPTEKHNAEERRKSMLDHHWAIPLKARNSVDMTSEASSTTAENNREDSLGDGSVPLSNTSSLAPPGTGDLPSLHLVKLSCHDSGIDIRDPMLNITPSNAKKVYSDADIVLSSDWVPPVTIAPAEAPLSAPPHSGPGGERPPTGRKPGSVSFSLDNGGNNDSSSSKEDSKADKKNKMLKRLSYPLSWMEGLTGDNTSSGSQGDSLPTSADSHNSGSVFSKVFNRRSSLGGFGRSEPKKAPVPPQSTAPKLDYRSMVSVDDMPELFVSFDKLIPRLARSCNDPPLYLRLRMGRPIGKPLPRTTPLMSYGKKRMRPEYWFSVPRNRVDDLFKFLNHWVPDRYGELGDVTARGYQLVDSDTDWDDEEEGPTREKGERTDSQGDVGDLTRESWEVLSMSDEVRRALYSSGASIDMEYSPPDLIGNTEILTMEHREKLCNVLPARAQGYMWSLVFNSSQHGFSLASMYRKMQRVDSPVLLIIQDTDNNVFGALTSKALHPSEHFYGTGESFLFSFAGSQSQPSASPTGQPPLSPLKKDFIKPAEGDLKLTDDEEPAIIESAAPTPVSPIKSAFRYWQWTGENMYFIRGSSDNISIGAGDGKFGLWLDGDLYLGRTQRCQTYENEPLTTREDFIVKILECWAFI